MIILCPSCRKAVDGHKACPICAALCSAKQEGEAKVDLGPERMRFVDAPDGGLDVVPMQREGGDEEDWPVAAYVSKDRYGARMAVGLVEPTEVPDGIEVHRYLPARATVAKRNLEKHLEEKKRECEEARDMYGAAGNVDSEAYWQGKGHGFASALAALHLPAAVPSEA